ncbi:MoxR-like ATPase protein [Vibrio virus vB_VspP_SBP1]|uniref:MoxR-like ATPase protein n=1 Tax=Vibrio virus vB_VspP_SBP1 TaxID=2500581 RepID=A0A3T0III7_9CAUD|nr:ATPase [Vibrio virus vB_VspP_SBP1]AZU99621.1 MoxR-like ATPase protein [Vibrio virus vB_VspP_SBP1]
MPVNSEQAREYVEDCLNAELVPFLKGAPGIGKSSIVKAIALVRNLLVIDVRLSQADPTDLNGFPFEKDGKATYIPFDTFPIVGDKLPVNTEMFLEKRNAEIAAGTFTKQDIQTKAKVYTDWATKAMEKCRYAGWLLFLDEFSSAPPAVQAAAYKLVLDKQVGKHDLHPDVHIVAAGNRVEDNAIANNIGTAMLSRVIHIEMESDDELWLAWAIGAGISHKIRDYVKWKGVQALNTFNPEQTEETFGCERTWEFANNLMEQWGDTVPGSKLTLLQGTIGTGLAQEFYNFLKVYKKIPDYAAIIANPKGTPVPDEPDRRFALTGVIAKNIEASTAGDAMKYIGRLPLEFQVICMKDIMKVNPGMSTNPDVAAWVKQNMNAMF